MKLIRFGDPGAEKPGIVINDQRFDASALCSDYNQNFFQEGGIAHLKSQNLDGLPQVSHDVRLGPPVASPSKIICVGLNYRQHAIESGMAIPAEPVIFFKAVSALAGPNDPILIPRGSKKTDWEVELAVVIGKKAQYVSEAEALNHIAGYVMHNDISEREYQLEKGGQWVKGKSFDNFAPMGPYLVTPDEIKDPHELKLWLKVNGKMMQNSTTADLVFKIPTLISYISQFMTLSPGDVISTGTPSGVGLGLDPPTYLKAGDQVELGIEGLGTSKQMAIAYDDN